MSANPSAPSRYSERVPASRWLVLLLWLGAAGSAVGGVVLMTTPGVSEVDRWVGGVTLIVSAIVLVAVARWFAQMRIDVDDRELRVGFGPIGRRVALGDIEAAEVAPYRWLPYGGWGIRYAFGRRRAYSQPFLSQGVEMHLRDGTRLFVTSRQPARLLEAVAAGRDRHRSGERSPRR